MKDIALFQALHQKMGWQTQRQSVLAQNIANADTPGYVPRDMKPLDFKALLATTGSGLPLGQGIGHVTLKATHSSHYGAAGASAVKAKNQKSVYETAPSGNSVILEEQLIKANQLAADHRLMTNLYQKNVNLLRTAVRGSGQ